MTQKQSKLSSKVLRFVEEYLVDLNGTQAATRAGYSPKTANEQAARMLAKASVQEEIAKRIKARSARVEITQDMVLRRFWQIAMADPNELISYRRVCCRHCYGAGHAFQWIDSKEHQQAVAAEIAAAKAEEREPMTPSSSGGFGFDRTLRPHPKCPECKGEGIGEVFANDTRIVSEEARALYAGVKVTKEGFEIKMQDQVKALEAVARHLGMFKDKVEVTGKDGGPIETKQLKDLSDDELLRIASGGGS